MKLIIGLGNPGSRYAKTRHNIGQRVVEELACRWKGRWKENTTLQCRWMKGDEKGIPFLVAIPGSFMNESGKVVQGLIQHFKIHFQPDLLTVVDDVMLPFGRLRIRASGSDGGHRGLGSIEAALGSQEYARLRVGSVLRSRWVGPSSNMC
jgi:PTH1 family peptidyl-tRNA hydrolase